MSIPLAHNLTIKELDRELGRYPHEVPDVWVGTVRLGLLRDMQAFMTWAVDEITQNRDDLKAAVQLGVKLALRITDLEQDIEDAMWADLRSEQTADYYRENV